MLIMKMLRKIKLGHFLTFIFILGVIVSIAPWAYSAVPRYINYQGKLTDASDNPVTGDVSIAIRIYDADTGGTLLWEEIKAVTVTRGIFSMLLGSTTALDSLDFNNPYWYSVEIESDGEMSPRQRLTAVGYAINADKLDGHDASDFLVSGADAEFSGNLTITSGGVITGGANEDVTIDPTGIGNVIVKIDSTSGDFKVTDGATTFFIVDNATGDVRIANDLTVTGTIYGNVASTGGASTFSGITVTGISDLQGSISNSAGNIVIADTLDLNSNLDLDYSGASAALAVDQASTGPVAQFTGQRVVIGASEITNKNALSAGELYVQGDLEVDGAIYGDITVTGNTTLGSVSLDDITVTGASDLQGDVSDSAGVFTIADNLSVTATNAATSGQAVLVTISPAFQDDGTDSTTTAVAMNIASTVNYTGSTKTGSYTALKITATETSLPTGANYLIDAYAGADGTTQKFSVNNSGNVDITGTLDMNNKKITNLSGPTADTDAATKFYVDNITVSSAGGWTDSGTAVHLLTDSDNVGIGTTSTGSYKLNVSGAVNADSINITGAGTLTSLSVSGGANFANTSGNVGIGTTTPSKKLTVAGVIKSTAGGFEFPDGTTLATAATIAPESHIDYIFCPFTDFMKSATTVGTTDVKNYYFKHAERVRNLIEVKGYNLVSGNPPKHEIDIDFQIPEGFKEWNEDGDGKAIMIDFNTDTDNDKTNGIEPITSLDLAIYFNGIQKVISENNTYSDYGGDASKNFGQAFLSGVNLNSNPDLTTAGNIIVVKAIVYCANNGTDNKVRISDLRSYYKTE